MSPEKEDQLYQAKKFVRTALRHLRGQVPHESEVRKVAERVVAVMPPYEIVRSTQ